ncbi:conserved hypothetical protein [Paraburkholderia ribeironis]|uniref:Uncharacterized protein n=1 Tax=Paraburkholderia ribeironis TaxID=1247936 RepID=A0A1N7RIE9_9BURK|nr:hypothetical protein [Paraburkholderia ribeironis]SIT34893.1 conserved hypothetical protein [Paraburkholderia ribeironis]
MASFKILLGNYSIVATNGASGGRQPVGKSDAVSFDVIDRRSQGNVQFAARDQTFSEAWDFCARRLLVIAASRPH